MRGQLDCAVLARRLDGTQEGFDPPLMRGQLGRAVASG